jgi:hypothetical protein
VAEMRPMQFMRVVGIIWSVLGREVDVPVRMFAEDVQAVQLMEGVDLGKVKLRGRINAHRGE